VQRNDVFRAWGRILSGYRPSLSIEITTRCPLSCPGCYAYEPEHLGGPPLKSLSDFQGDDLVARVLELVDHRRPLIVHIVGGEPLVRYRELMTLLPRLSARGIHVEVVTSAVRRIPPEWADIERLNVVVSIDGLQPEHDARRKPATYARILEHIEGHRIVVHCTITNQMTERPDYLSTFVEFWSSRREVGSIRFSFFTPQVGASDPEIPSPVARVRAVAELGRLAPLYPKVRITPGMLRAYLKPPSSPERCIFAHVTECVSADLKTQITPCQFGGTPDCTRCGCVASVGLETLGEYRLPGGIKVHRVFDASERIGASVRQFRERIAG
jgi:MoaA/NifB/PqqE/SkfB family radical SAM enzyme